MKRPCENASEACRYYETGCYADVHHVWWPRRKYRSQVERQFRELPENKEVLCREAHDDLHATTRPPVKPPREVMIRAIGQHSIEEVA